MKKPVRVAVTGAAGQISYAMLFRIAAGDMLGPDQPVILQLLEIPPAMDALQGVVMELDDCAFPLLHAVECSDDPVKAFKDTDFAMLVGARPRGPGMERKDLLTENAKIFSVQGKALNAQFTAMTRLDHNRAISQLAQKTGAATTDVARVTIWGNHSATQYPDIHHATVKGESAITKIDHDWMVDDFIPTVQQRGAAIIKARGASSAASAASAAIDHMRTWAQGTAESDWVSMAIPSTGHYGIESGLIYSFPVRCANGKYEVVEGLEINAFSEERMRVTEQELREERDGVKDLLG